MIKLGDENRILVPTGGVEDAAYLFPSFTDMRESIDRLLRRKIVVDGTEVQVREEEERIRMFNTECKGTVDLPARNGTAGVVEMSTLEGWKDRIPPNVKVAATGPFDECRARILPAEVFEAPITVEVDAVVGKVRFDFPPLEDMAGELKALMDDRVRTRGRRIEDRRTHARLKFFRAALAGVYPDDVDFEVPKTIPKGKTLGGVIADAYPVNWISGAVQAFETTEALVDDEAGN